mgnify:CR=1 FL=1
MSLASAKVLIAIIGLGLASAAIAEDLVYYGTDRSKSDYYYDAESIRRYNDGDVDVWTKRNALKDKTVSYRTQRAKLRLNCASETISSLSFVLYRANGTVVDSDTPIYPDIESVVPGSVGQTLFDIMCETDLRRQFNLGLKYAEGKGVAIKGMPCSLHTEMMNGGACSDCAMINVGGLPATSSRVCARRDCSEMCPRYETSSWPKT